MLRGRRDHGFAEQANGGDDHGYDAVIMAVAITDDRQDGLR